MECDCTVFALNLRRPPPDLPPAALAGGVLEYVRIAYDCDPHDDCVAIVLMGGPVGPVALAGRHWTPDKQDVARIRRAFDDAHLDAHATSDGDDDWESSLSVCLGALDAMKSYGRLPVTPVHRRIVICSPTASHGAIEQALRAVDVPADVGVDAIVSGGPCPDTPAARVRTWPLAPGAGAGAVAGAFRSIVMRHKGLRAVTASIRLRKKRASEASAAPAPAPALVTMDVPLLCAMAECRSPAAADPLALVMSKGVGAYDFDADADCVCAHRVTNADGAHPNLRHHLTVLTRSLRAHELLLVPLTTGAASAPATHLLMRHGGDVFLHCLRPPPPTEPSWLRTALDAASAPCADAATTDVVSANRLFPVRAAPAWQRQTPQGSLKPQKRAKTG